MARAAALPRLRWATLVRPGVQFHLARTHLAPRDPGARHTHDFAEAMWVESGRLRQTTPDRAEELPAGTLVLIPPTLRHEVHGLPPEGGTLVNVAFPRAVLALLEKRYGGADRPVWGTRDRARIIALPEFARERLTAWVDILQNRETSALDRDGFLLDLLRLSRTERPAADVPDWLAAALAALEQPPALARGMKALVEITGRTREHISRVIRKSLGETATDAINRLRLRYAAAQLRLSQRTILDLCYACGFSNVGHFYRLFRARYGQTPRRYRLEARAGVQGPLEGNA